MLESFGSRTACKAPPIATNSLFSIRYAFIYNIDILIGGHLRSLRLQRRAALLPHGAAPRQRGKTLGNPLLWVVAAGGGGATGDETRGAADDTISREHETP